MWGIGLSLIEACKYDEVAVDGVRIGRLAKLASRCLATPGVGLSTLSMAGCMCAFSKHRPTNKLISSQISATNEVHGDFDDALRAMLRPPYDKDPKTGMPLVGVTKRGTGWVRATTAAAVGCLAMHE